MIDLANVAKRPRFLYKCEWCGKEFENGYAYACCQKLCQICRERASA